MPDHDGQEPDIRPARQPTKCQQNQVGIAAGSNEPIEGIQWTPDENIE
jgi:hypothetical protein